MAKAIPYVLHHLAASLGWTHVSARRKHLLLSSIWGEYVPPRLVGKWGLLGTYSVVTYIGLIHSAHHGRTHGSAPTHRWERIAKTVIFWLTGCLRGGMAKAIPYVSRHLTASP